MNSREKFLATMRFEAGAPANKWEFGYWAATVEQWYEEGLPRTQYPTIPAITVNTTSSLYSAVWTHEWRKSRTLVEKVFGHPASELRMPKGMPVVGGGIYWPTQGLPIDEDVKSYFGMDVGQITVCAEQLVCPNFEVEILAEDEESFDYIDLDGCTRRYSKTEQVIPAGIKWPITGTVDWLDYKNQRMRLDNIRDRLPPHWPELVREYRSRSYPLTLGGYPNGLFGSLTHLMGYENLFISYHQQPELVHDILTRMTEVWIALWEEILADTDVDMCHFWEDISFGRGSMISPGTFRQFLLPYYRRLTDFLRSKGVSVILVDTDGDCNELIPLFLEGGITGLYPMEVSAGMDVVSVRKRYPELQIMGGIPKGDIALGERRIRDILEPVQWLLSRGGYIPYGDHLIPPDVHWADFVIYRRLLNELIDSAGKGDKA